MLHKERLSMQPLCRVLSRLLYITFVYFTYTNTDKKKVYWINVRVDKIAIGIQQLICPNNTDGTA